MKIKMKMNVNHVMHTVKNVMANIELVAQNVKV